MSNIDFQPIERTSNIDFQPIDESDRSSPQYSKMSDIIGKPVTSEDIKNKTKGLIQGAENVGIGYLNLLPKVNIKKANWAGENPETKKVENAVDIGSFFLPGSAAKAARYIPVIGDAIKSAASGLSTRPVLNAVSKLAGSTASGALSSAALADQENQNRAALLGGGLGAGSNVLAQALNVKNPFVNALLRGGIGAGAGVAATPITGQNPFLSAAEGAGAGIGAPYALKGLGIGAMAPGLETLEHLTPQEVTPAVQAANRLNTPITPSEASGNPFVGGIEGRFGRTGEAAALKTSIGQERVKAQKSAIDDLMDTIYDKSTPEAAKASQQKIQQLYGQAYKWNLDPKTVSLFKQDPVINDAFNAVKSDSAYQRKLAGIPENNFAYLNQVKRALSDMEKSALKRGELDRAEEFNDARNDLVAQMDKHVPVYATARAEAQKAIIRRSIQKAMRKKELKGSDFYSTLLKNEDEFTKLHDDLKNVPEAQDKLNDMRLAWRNLINLEKPRSAAFRSETGLSQSRNWVDKLVDIWNQITGGKRNIEAVKFIHSSDWDKSFARIAEIKEQSKRKEALANLIAKLTTAVGSTNSQGSE